MMDVYYVSDGDKDFMLRKQAHENEKRRMTLSGGEGMLKGAIILYS